MPLPALPVAAPALAYAVAPAPKPYVLPGHALPLDEELKLVSGLQANPAGSGSPLATRKGSGDLIVAAAGLITPAVGAQPYPRQTTGASVGGLVATEIRPRRWIDLQINYELSHVKASFASQPGGQLLASFGSYVQEASAEYLLSRQPDVTAPSRLRPFLGLGGGLLQFSAAAPYSGQTRGAYLVDPGVDVPTRNDNISFRVDARAVIYRAPNFGASGLANSAWTTTVEPTVGVVWHF